MWSRLENTEYTFSLVQKQKLYYFKVLFFFFCFETKFHFVSQAGLKLRIFLPQPLEGWEDGYVAQNRFLNFVFLTMIK